MQRILPAGILALGFWILAAAPAQAIGVGRHHLQGPFGLPSLRALDEKLQLTHAESEQILRLYNEYRHRTHARHHLTLTDKEGGHASLRKELISKIEAILTPAQRTLFEELLKHHGKKKPTTSSSGASAVTLGQPRAV